MRDRLWVHKKYSPRIESKDNSNANGLYVYWNFLNDFDLLQIDAPFMHLTPNTQYKLHFISIANSIKSHEKAQKTHAKLSTADHGTVWDNVFTRCACVFVCVFMCVCLDVNSDNLAIKNSIYTNTILRVDS